MHIWVEVEVVQAAENGIGSVDGMARSLILSLLTSFQDTVKLVVEVEEEEQVQKLLWVLMKTTAEEEREMEHRVFSMQYVEEVAEHHLSFLKQLVIGIYLTVAQLIMSTLGQVVVERQGELVEELLDEPHDLLMLLEEYPLSFHFF